MRQLLYGLTLYLISNSAFSQDWVTTICNEFEQEIEYATSYYETYEVGAKVHSSGWKSIAPGECATFKTVLHENEFVVKSSGGWKWYDIKNPESSRNMCVNWDNDYYALDYLESAGGPYDAKDVLRCSEGNSLVYAKYMQDYDRDKEYEPIIINAQNAIETPSLVCNSTSIDLKLYYTDYGSNPEGKQERITYLMDGYLSPGTCKAVTQLTDKHEQYFYATGVGENHGWTWESDEGSGGYMCAHYLTRDIPFFVPTFVDSEFILNELHRSYESEFYHTDQGGILAMECPGSILKIGKPLGSNESWYITEDNATTKGQTREEYLNYLKSLFYQNVSSNLSVSSGYDRKVFSTNISDAVKATALGMAHNGQENFPYHIDVLKAILIGSYTAFYDLEDDQVIPTIEIATDQIPDVNAFQQGLKAIPVLGDIVGHWLDGTELQVSLNVSIQLPDAIVRKYSAVEPRQLSVQAAAETEEMATIVWTTQGFVFAEDLVAVIDESNDPELEVFLTNFADSPVLRPYIDALGSAPEITSITEPQITALRSEGDRIIYGVEVAGTAVDQDGDLQSVHFAFEGGMVICQGGSTFDCYMEIPVPSSNLPLLDVPAGVFAKDGRGLESEPEMLTLQFPRPNAPVVNTVNLQNIRQVREEGEFAIFEIKLSGTASDQDNDLDVVNFRLPMVTGTVCLGTLEFNCILEVRVPKGDLPKEMNDYARVVAGDSVGNESEPMLVDLYFPAQEDQCVSAISTIDNHVAHNRAYAVTGGYWIWTYTDYFAVGSEENLGRNVGANTISLKDEESSGYWVSGECLVIEPVPPVIDSVTTPSVTRLKEENGVVYFKATIHGAASDANGDLKEVRIGAGMGYIPCQGAESFTCEAEINVTKSDLPVQASFFISAVDNAGNHGEVIETETVTFQDASNCVTSSNPEHVETGRAYVCGQEGFWPYVRAKGCATGSEDYIGTDLDSSSLLEQLPGYWVKVNSCPN